MNQESLLGERLVWDEEGHLSELASSALADGQDAILPANAIAHFASCDGCALRVGEAAILSAEVGASFKGGTDRDLPWVPVALALALAGVSSVPLLSTARSWLSSAGWIVAHAVPIMGHTFVRFAEHRLSFGFYVACTATMLAMAAAIARASRGAVQ